MRIAGLAVALDRAVHRIEADVRLDGIADRFAPVARKAFPDGPV
jgi:hypothetical protein